MSNFQQQQHREHQQQQQQQIYMACYKRIEIKSNWHDGDDESDVLYKVINMYILFLS